MKNPRLSAALSAAAVIFFAYQIFFSTEQPSPTLAMLQWVFLFLAAIGLVGALIRMSKGE